MTAIVLPAPVPFLVFGAAIALFAGAVRGFAGFGLSAFIVAGIIRWWEVLPMIPAAVIGGYVAAHAAQRLDQRLIKGLVIVLGAAVTAYFFWRGV